MSADHLAPESTVSAEVDVAGLRELLAAATPGPWEVGDYWHIQGAKWCRCDAGPLVWSGVREINGTRMEEHIHRRTEPIGNDIMQSDASDGDPANISYGSDFGPGLEDADAALVATAVNALPALLDLAERVQVVEGERDAAKAEAWDEAAEATAEWMANNPGPSGIPHDPPANPYLNNFSANRAGLAGLLARAESAEAALAAVVAGVENLIRAAEFRANSSLSRNFNGRPVPADVAVSSLRALLTGATS